MATLPQLIEDDIAVLDDALQRLLTQTEASAAMIIDKGGFLIAQKGDSANLDAITLAALAAASFAATQSIATLVCEDNFASVYQQGEKHSLLVENVDQHCLLTVVFRASLSVGAIKYYAGATTKEIAKQMNVAQARNPEGGLDLSMRLRKTIGS